jgi:hypothetical protein
MSAEVLIETGLLFRLESLNLEHGNMTDVGVEQLLETLEAHEHQLKELNLNENAIQDSSDWADEFEALGIDCQINSQHGGGNDYLFNGDIE